MSTRKIENRRLRNLQRSHGTYLISLPIEIIRSLNWQEKQKVIVKKYGRHKILISDWKK